VSVDCQNLEYFSQDMAAGEGALGHAPGKRLFNARLGLIGELDQKRVAADRHAAHEQRAAPHGHPETDGEVAVAGSHRHRRKQTGRQRGGRCRPA
jgi:type I site-specific restriction endonuclease